MVPHATTPHPLDDVIADWCARHLGAAPARTFFAASSMSQVFGIELSDRRLIALKLRAPSRRLVACEQAHRLAHRSGIACPEPLAGPEPLGGDEALWVSAESWWPDGATEPARDPAVHYAGLLAALVDSCAGLDPAEFAPAPPWLCYDHTSPGRVWPPAFSDRWDPHRIAGSLPPDLIGMATAARERLLAAELTPVVGHSDLNGLNVRWIEGPRAPRPIVHDWDSLAGRPEAVLVGCLAADHVSVPDHGAIAPIDQGWLVLGSYQRARRREFSADEIEVAWAAGTWVACYNAAFEYLHGSAGSVTRQILQDGAQRLRLAGT